MPSKNTVKFYKSNSIYHVFNKGANKQKIFLSNSDYTYFIKLLEKYLSRKYSKRYKKDNLYTEVTLFAYCLMPNHFHLIIKQRNKTGMTRLLRRIMTSYSMYFNKKYNHSGHVFQGIYKAVSIKSEKQLFNTIEYVHDNPSELSNDINAYSWSSVNCYRTNKSPDWIRILPEKDDPLGEVSGRLRRRC